MTAGYTQTPNQLLDEMMPYLSGSEFKIIMYTIRKTLGYQKKTDRISVSQYMEGTGLTKPTVIKALEALQSLNILRVINEATRQGTEWVLSITEDIINAIKNRNAKPPTRATKPEEVVKKFNHFEDDPLVKIFNQIGHEGVKIFYQLWLKNFTSKWLKNFTHKRKVKENSKEIKIKKKECNYEIPELEFVDISSLPPEEALAAHNQYVKNMTDLFLQRMAKTR